MYFDYPVLDASDTVTGAQLNLYQHGCSPATFSNYEVDAHKVDSTFNTATLTWANQPVYDNSIEDYGMMDGNNGTQRSWDITDIVKNWYCSGHNTGVVLTANNESTLTNVNYYSSDYPGLPSNAYPCVYIHYVSNVGLEDYWTYHNQDGGRAGQGYINDYTGNATIEESDLSETGNILPVSISHVFNNFSTVSSSAYSSQAVKYGNGWKLNAVQKILPSSSGLTSAGYPYYLIDEDGTQHYFTGTGEPSGTYVDEDGLSLTLTIPKTDNTHYYRIALKDGSRETFDNLGYLRIITDINGNTINFNYSPIPDVDDYLSSITDGAGRTTSLVYDSNHVLTDIIDPSGRDTSYHYGSAGHLTSINYPDGKSVSYTYDNNNRITSMKDIDGSTVNYDYDMGSETNLSGKVTSIVQKGTDLLQGVSLTVQYPQTNLTVFTDNKSRVNTYHFDNSGRTIDVTDGNGKAEYYKYTDADAGSTSPINNATKNTDSLESKMQSSIINLLKNHSFELSTDWSSSLTGTPSGTAGYSTSDNYYGNSSMKITKTDQGNDRLSEMQSLNLTAGGTYTLSGYVKTADVSPYNGGGAEIFVLYYDLQGVGHFLEGPTVTGTNDWNRYSYTVNLPANQSAYAMVSIVNGTGTAYFDDVQLEQGNTVNRYNLVENQSFESNSSGIPANWTGSNLSSSDKIKNDNKHSGSNGFLITGNASTAKTLSQTIKVSGSGSTNDSFVINGWSKTDSVPVPDSSRKFDIKVQLNYTDGTHSSPSYVTFNPDDEYVWQYASDVIISDKKAYSSITVSLEYCNNANSAFFDDIQVYKEEFGQSYTYDANGNIVTTKDLASKNSQFAYDSDNNLVSAADPTGASFAYTYDAMHNPVSAQNQTNENYDFHYNSQGSPISASVIGRESATAITNGQIYYIRSNNSKLYLDVNQNADSDNAPVYQNSFNGGTNQQFKAIDMGGGTFQFIPLNSATGRALAVQGGATADSTPIVINTNNGSNGEIWKPDLNADGSFTMESKCTSYASCIDDRAFGTTNAALVQHSVNGGMNQEWTFEVAGNAQPTAASVSSVTNGQYYYVKSVCSNLYMQAKNDGTASGTGVVQNYFTGKASQQWMIAMNSNGTYKLINNNSSLLLTVPGGQNVDSLAFDTEAQGAGAAQQYTPTYNGDGTFRILTQVSNNLRSLNVKGASTAPGAVIQQYTYNGATNEQWILYPVSGTTSVTSGQQYYLQSLQSGLCLQPTNGSTAANTGIEQNTYTGQTTQRWQIVSTGTNTYKLLCVGSNLALDVPKAQNADSVALQSYGDNGTLAQQWNVVYNGNGTFKVLSGCSSGSKCMEVKGASTAAGAVIQQYTYNGDANQKWLLLPVQETNDQLSSSAAYTSDGNYMTSLTDSGGNTVSSDYGQSLGTSEYKKGLLRSTTDANGSKTSYSYDANTDNLTSVSATADGNNVTNSYAYNNDQLSSITHNGFNYSFNYDAFGNTKSVDVGNQELVNNNYGPNNGNLTGINYGNGQQIGYSYDPYDRVTSKSYNGTDQYGWIYDAEGNVASVTDSVNSNTYKYTYDFASRPTQMAGSNGHSLSYSYDSNSKVNKLVQTLNGTQYTSSLFFNGDGLLTQLSEGLGDFFSKGYDSLGRVNSEQFKYKTGSTYNTFTGNYTYQAGANGNTTTQVSQLNYTKTVNGVQTPGVSLGYTYDQNGNISTISSGGTQQVKYYYDELNELTREDNAAQNQTITYTYDAGGNITAKTLYPYTTGSLTEVTPAATNTYGYGNNNWNDELTSYNGNTITYDEIGNPLSYYNGLNFTWQDGRQLATATNDSNSISYKYNSDGERTQKTVNGVTTTYYMEGNQVSWQTDGTNTIHYVYNTDGNLVYMLLNGTIYYYERNAQGDIIGLVDSSMNEVVTYSYDTWGKLLDIGGSLADTVGAVNPFRYRGYMYDTETGLYYLQSRYYDPNTGRFLNSDGAVSTGTGLLGHNMFAYCNNNPVMMSDSDGTRPDVAGTITETAAETAQSTAAMYSKGQNQKYVNSVKASNSRGSTGTIARVAAETGKNAAEGVADTIVGAAIKKLPAVRYSIERVGPGLGVELEHADKLESVAALKGISKVTGVVGAVGYVWDIGSDIYTYHNSSSDLKKALFITGTAIGICVAAGLICTGFGAPVGVTLAVGLFAGAGSGLLEDYEKKKWIGY